MATEKQAIAVYLDPVAKLRVEKAATLTGQTPDAFLEHAADDMARRVLLDWAVAHYQDGERTFSELAGETGLAVEEIMRAMGDHGRDAALDRFLASARASAAAQDNPRLRELAERAVEILKDAHS